MARRTAPRKSSARRRTPPAARAVHAYLAPLMRILAAGGHAASVIRQQANAICDDLPTASPKRSLDRDLIDLPHVLSLWHADPAYLDANGQPRALKLTGAHSLSSLVRRVFPHRSPQTVIRALDRNGVLQRIEGRVLPTGRTLRFDPTDGIPHGLEALLGLLRTIEYNLDHRGAEDRLFERVARNPRIPERHAPTFHALARGQLLTLLVRLDGELARMEADRRPRERTIPIGVGAYMISEAHPRRPR